MGTVGRQGRERGASRASGFGFGGAMFETERTRRNERVDTQEEEEEEEEMLR